MPERTAGPLPLHCRPDKERRGSLPRTVTSADVWKKVQRKQAMHA